MGVLDPDDPRPPFRQVADVLRSGIESGTLAPGEQLPTLQALASQYGVSIGTVKSALGVLRELGLIVSRQGKGSYVRTRASHEVESPPDELADLRLALDHLTKRVDEVERRLTDR